MDTGCLVVPSPHLPMAAQSFLVAACPGGKNTVSDDVSNNQGFSASVPLNLYEPLIACIKIAVGTSETREKISKTMRHRSE